METFHFPLTVLHANDLQFYVTLLLITIDDNRRNQNNYECMKAILHSVRYSSQILTKLEYVNKYQ